MAYGHVTADERRLIGNWSREGETKAEIARRLGRDRATVGREMVRNRGLRGYRHKQAQTMTEARGKRPGRRKLTPEMEDRILEGLKAGWTPEAIHGRAGFEGIPMVCRETIYQFIYADAKAGGTLFHRLPRAHRKRRRRCPRADGRGRGRIPNQRRIDTRPPEVETRSRVGDWEGDLVLGARNTGNLVTLVDRRTRFSLVGHVAGKGAEEVRDQVVALFRALPPEVRRTATFDNGKEFAAHEEIALLATLDVFFAYPYHSWERGSNEHLNGIIRRRHPKGSPFTDLQGEGCVRLARHLNGRPMKCLGWLTPQEAMDRHLALLLR